MLNDPINDDRNEGDNDSWIFEYNFQVKQIFEKSDGKYSEVFGNVAFIDCNYVFITLIASIKSQLQESWFNDTPVTYNEVITALDKIEAYVKNSGVTLCDFAYEIDGCLKDQPSYYIDSYDEILSSVS